MTLCRQVQKGRRGVSNQNTTNRLNKGQRTHNREEEDLNIDATKVQEFKAFLMYFDDTVSL